MAQGPSVAGFCRSDLAVRLAFFAAGFQGIGIQFQPLTDDLLLVGMYFL